LKEAAGFTEDRVDVFEAERALGAVTAAAG
jgi:hypothetical protein